MNTETRSPENGSGEIRVIELFGPTATLSGGLMKSSPRFVTVWSNSDGVDMADIKGNELPAADMIVCDLPLKDFSYGAADSEWWRLWNILSEMPSRPGYLFLESADRLTGSPVEQRGRDLAVILAALSDLGYIAVWRVINTADYGLPQRKRCCIFAFRDDSPLASGMPTPFRWLGEDGIMAKAFPVRQPGMVPFGHTIDGSLEVVASTFNNDTCSTPFKKAGLVIARKYYTTDLQPDYHGETVDAGELLAGEANPPQSGACRTALVNMALDAAIAARVGVCLADAVQ